MKFLYIIVYIHYVFFSFFNLILKKLTIERKSLVFCIVVNKVETLNKS